jgi:hypothetical protein
MVSWNFFYATNQTFYGPGFVFGNSFCGVVGESTALFIALSQDLGFIFVEF